MHAVNGVIVSIKAGETKDIPDKIAKIWLASEDIVKVDDGAKDAELVKLKEENEKLKAQLNSGNDESNDESAEEREKLIAECKELGVKGVYNKKVSLEIIKQKLAETKSA